MLEETTPTTGDINPKFELMVLGAALTDEDSWDVISRKVRENHFGVPDHRDFYAEVLKADEEGRRTDADLIAQALADKGIETAYELITAAITNPAPHSTLDNYIGDLRVRAQSRASLDYAATFQNALSNVNGDMTELASVVGEHEERLRELAEDVADTPWQSIGSLMSTVAQGDTRLAVSMPTGFPSLDQALQGGFRPGQMVVLAGRPAMGKTTLATDFARYASLHRDIPGLMVSLEMGVEEMATRITAAEEGIPLGNLLKGEISSEERQRVLDARDRLQESPLFIVDGLDGTWDSIRATIMSACRREDIKYVIIDFLQLVTKEMRSRGASRENEVAAISRAIKLLAKQMGITIIAVAQLNRDVDKRNGNVPQMSDLRESGAIEQDADIIGLVHRPDYYDEMSDRQGEADFILAKQRNGGTATIKFLFQGHYSRFVSLAYTDQYESSVDSYPES